MTQPPSPDVEIDDKVLEAELKKALAKMRNDVIKRQEQRMYAVFAADDIFLARVKKSVLGFRSDVNITYTVFISGGESSNMKAFDIAGHKVYISVGHDY